MFLATLLIGSLLLCIVVTCAVRMSAKLVVRFDRWPKLKSMSVEIEATRIAEQRTNRLIYTYSRRMNENSLIASNYRL